MNWPLVRFSQSLAQVIRGVTFSQGDAITDPNPDTIPVLRAGNIQDKLIVDHDLVWIPLSFVSDAQRLQKNDIVVCMSSGSAAIVGKSAILEDDFEGTWGAFNAVIRVRPDLLLPRFLFYWLRSAAFLAWRGRQVQGANIQNIRLSDLASIQIPLPTRQEQQRIVDVLQQAEEINKAKRSISSQIDNLIQTLYWQHFSAWYTPDGLRDPVRISEYVKDSQYGVSEAMEEEGSHAVLRMNSITSTGWLDLSDLKYINLSKKDADNTTLENGDILFNRTNSKELVGKCAIWRDTEKLFSFASYLVRLRLKDGMLPEYLWATLNSAYGKYRLLNAAKQAVSMANVSPTDLGRITVPLPPFALQESFARLVQQVEALRTEMLEKVEAFGELQSLVTQQALLGDLTKSWREKHQQEIAKAAAERDAVLGASKAKFSVQITETAPPERPTDFSRPARRWLIDELSELQREVWSMLRDEWKASVIVDDPEIFKKFCTNPQTAWRLERFKVSPSHIRRTLEQLAALGLIAKISLPKTNALTQQTEYLTAFRPLREGENTRLADADLLRRELRE